MRQDVAQAATVGDAELDVVLRLVCARRPDRSPHRCAHRRRGAGCELRIGDALALQLGNHLLREIGRDGAETGFGPLKAAEHGRTVFLAAAGSQEAPQILRAGVAGLAGCGGLLRLGRAEAPSDGQKCNRQCGALSRLMKQAHGRPLIVLDGQPSCWRFPPSSESLQRIAMCSAPCCERSPCIAPGPSNAGQGNSGGIAAADNTFAQGCHFIGQAQSVDCDAALQSGAPVDPSTAGLRRRPEPARREHPLLADR